MTTSSFRPDRRGRSRAGTSRRGLRTGSAWVTLVAFVSSTVAPSVAWAESGAGNRVDARAPDMGAREVAVAPRVDERAPGIGARELGVPPRVDEKLPGVGARVTSLKGDGEVVRHNVLKQTAIVRRADDGTEVEVTLEELVEKRAE